MQGPPNRLGRLRRRALFGGEVFDLAFHGLERIAQGNKDIFVDMRILGIAANDQFRTGNGHIDANMERLPFVMQIRGVGVMAFHGNPAADDFVVKLFQLGGFFADTFFHSIGMIYSMKADLNGKFHGHLLLVFV